VGIRDLAGAALLISAYCQQLTPGSPEREAILSRIREGAISYADRLQDFVCNRVTVRSAGVVSPHTRWKRLEIQEHELAYVGHREQQRLLKVNGQPPESGQKIKGGYFSPGSEFGSYFQKVFDPAAKAEFTWDHEAQTDGGLVCVFRYSVPLSTSTWSVSANGQEFRLAHHGLVDASCDTGAVVRLRLETEAPNHEPVGIQTDIYYGSVQIAGKQFLLPVKVEEIARYLSQLTKVEMQFRDYRKYSADSTITFK